MKKIYILFATSFFIFPCMAGAIPLIDIEIGAGYNFLSPSGNVKYKDGLDLEVVKNLNMDDSKDFQGQIVIDIPVIPTIKLEYSPFRFQGEKKVDFTETALSFGDVAFDLNSTIKSDINFEQTDLSLYYSIPIPYVKPRFGLSVKHLNGYTSLSKEVSSGAGTVTTMQKGSMSYFIPMAHVGLNVTIPLSSFLPFIEGLGFDVQGKWIGTGSALSLTDYYVKTRLTMIEVALIGSAYIGGGYRHMSLTALEGPFGSDSDLKAQLTFAGGFGEIGLEF